MNKIILRGIRRLTQIIKELQRNQKFPFKKGEIIHIFAKCSINTEMKMERGAM